MQAQGPAIADGGVAALDPDDLDILEESERSQILPAFLGVSSAPSSLHYSARSPDGRAPAYVFDEESGMIYVLD